MAKIVLEEAIGFNVEMDPFIGTSSWYTIRALAGCNPLKDKMKPCFTDTQPLSDTPPHFIFEGWSMYIPTDFSNTIGVPSSREPTLIPLSYEGEEAMCIESEFAEHVYRTTGNDLTYYHNYDATWRNQSKFFSTIPEVVKAAGKAPIACDIDSPYNTLFQAQAAEKYAEYTKDTAGVTKRDDGVLVAVCKDGWWHSPACRNTDSCIPFITLNTYLVHAAMQWAAFFNIPLAIASYINAADEPKLLPAIVNKTKVLFFETLHSPKYSGLSKVPKAIVWPVANPFDTSKGLFQTATSKARVLKGASAGLNFVSPQAFSFFRKVDVALDDIAQSTIWAKDLGARKAACKWLHSNEARWKDWLPEKVIKCEKGYEHKENKCVKCTPGYFSPAAGVSTKCFACEPGKYQEKDGAHTCKVCLPGHATKTSHATACDGCLPGTVASSFGATVCQDCVAGTFGNSTGESKCSRCLQATYSDAAGATMCKPCGEVLRDGVTLFMGASSAADCTCPMGTYRAGFTQNICVRCTEGMLCDETGLMAPKQAAGFYFQERVHDTTLTTYSGYRCRNHQECPAGVVGTCAAGRADVACGNCIEQHYKAKNGECRECKGADFLPIIFFVVLMAGGLVPLYFYASADVAKGSLSGMTVALSLGQLGVMVQTLATFNALDISWSEPIASVMDILNIFVFNLDVIKIQCAFAKDDPVLNFVATLLVFPAFIAALGCMVGLLRIAGKKTLGIDHYLNLVGLSTLVFYMSVTMIVLQPLHCVANPNGTSSMASNPSVLCWDSPAHSGLVILGICGLLMYPTAILVTIARITYLYPALVASGYGLQVLVRYRFLFHRFTAACYFWGLCYTLRNLLVSLTPVIFSDMGLWQVVVINILLVVSSLATAHLVPWRTPLANTTEVGSTAGLIIFMQMASFYVGADGDVDGDSLGTALTVILFSLVAMMLTVLAWSVYSRFAPREGFGAFLCHHKEGAGSLARFTKSLIEIESSIKVFLDSDQLSKIDLIFDIVRSMVKHLVVLQTKMVLTRPWCAGEMATAMANSVPMVPVACNDYQVPVDLEFTQLNSQWSEEQKQLLGHYGINLVKIKTAYRHLSSLQAIELDRFSPLGAQEDSLRSVISACGGSRSSLCRSLSRCTTTMSSSSSSVAARAVASVAVTDVRIVVTTCTVHAESRCTAEILSSMVQTETHVVAQAVHSSFDVVQHLETVDYCIPVLTNGLLEDTEFGNLLFVMERGRQAEQVKFAPVLADNTFSFPGPEFYARLQNVDARGLCLAASFRRLLNVLAVSFAPHASSAILHAQVLQICGRLEDCEKPQRSHHLVDPSGAEEAAKMIHVPSLPKATPGQLPQTSTSSAGPSDINTEAAPSDIRFVPEAEPPVALTGAEKVQKKIIILGDE